MPFYKGRRIGDEHLNSHIGDDGWLKVPKTKPKNIDRLNALAQPSRRRQKYHEIMEVRVCVSMHWGGVDETYVGVEMDVWRLYMCMFMILCAGKGER
jgi:hypothetical protein